MFFLPERKILRDHVRDDRYVAIIRRRAASDRIMPEPALADREVIDLYCVGRAENFQKERGGRTCGRFNSLVCVRLAIGHASFVAINKSLTGLSTRGKYLSGCPYI